MTTTIITRQEALEKGLGTYFTGEPCLKGHIAPRITKRYKCVGCKREWEKEWRTKNPEKDKAIRKREVRKNKKSYQRRTDSYIERRGKEQFLSERRDWRQNNPEKVAECIERRNGHLRDAKPNWANNETLKEIYMERDRLVKKTGIPHHVHHIIPICELNYVSGLHCEANLIIVTEDEHRELHSSEERLKLLW